MFVVNYGSQFLIDYSGEDWSRWTLKPELATRFADEEDAKSVANNVCGWVSAAPATTKTLGEVAFDAFNEPYHTNKSFGNIHCLARDDWERAAQAVVTAANER